jgi:hypothetical protein
MKYDNLEEWARRDVWKPFLNRVNTIGGPASVSTAELDRLIAFASNGRQVRIEYVASFFKCWCLDNRLKTMSDSPMFSRPLVRFHWVFLTLKQLSEPMDYLFQIQKLKVRVYPMITAFMRTINGDGMNEWTIQCYARAWQRALSLDTWHWKTKEAKEEWCLGLLVRPAGLRGPMPWSIWICWASQAFIGYIGVL